MIIVGLLYTSFQQIIMDNVHLSLNPVECDDLGVVSYSVILSGCRLAMISLYTIMHLLLNIV